MLAEAARRAVRDALQDTPRLVSAAAVHVRQQVPALQGLPDEAVEGFVELLVGDAAHALLHDAGPSDDVLRQLEPFVVQRAELGVAVDDILRGLHLGSGVVIDALLDRPDPELTGRQTADLMRRIESWLDLVRRQVLLVHRRTEIELAEAGRDRSSALLASLLDEQQRPDRAELARLGVSPEQPLHLTRTRPDSPGRAWATERAVRAHLDSPAISGIADGDVVTVGLAEPAAAPVGLRQSTAGSLALHDLPEAHALLGFALDLDSAPVLVPLHRVADRVAQARNDLLGRLLRDAFLGNVDPSRRQHHDLLQTVAAYLDRGGRLDRAAAELHLHPNTVKHRLSRFRSLTGEVLDDPSSHAVLRWAVHVALSRPGAWSPATGAAGRTQLDG